MPHLYPSAAIVFKWTLSAVMILPQSVLLGMTFPLMTAGVIRWRPDDPGRTISLLYFVNSIGAASGVLVSGFMLIRLLGLPWTIRTAGFINLALALVVWRLAKGHTAVSGGAEAGQKTASREKADGRGLFLFASFLTGAASFIYEIGWIRMLNLVLGSSTHAFELMLSAFILGLALGGLWIQRRIDSLFIPERYLAGVQVVMGLLALFTLPLYGQTFAVMQWLINTLNRTDAGYVLFNLSSNALALAVMLPATFLRRDDAAPHYLYADKKRAWGEEHRGCLCCQYGRSDCGCVFCNSSRDAAARIKGPDRDRRLPRYRPWNPPFLESGSVRFPAAAVRNIGSERLRGGRSSPPGGSECLQHDIRGIQDRQTGRAGRDGSEVLQGRKNRHYQHIPEQIYRRAGHRNEWQTGCVNPGLNEQQANRR
jgi:hypothetical protein